MKKVFIAFGVILVASMARASYLYWQLDSTPEGTDMVKLKSDAGDVVVYGLDVDAVSGDAQPTAYTGSLQAGQTYYIADNPSVNSYYLEYYNNDVKTGESTSISRDTLVTYNEGLNVTTESLGDIAEVSPIWHAATGSMSPAPEPTSAILMMFGMAFLGLKRKNRSIA